MQFPRVALEKEYKVRETALFREDNLFMSVEGVTEIEDEAFEVVHIEDFHPIPSKPTQLLSLYFRMDRDVGQVERQIYDAFTLLGDVGGL